ncbi:hypothetical protein AWW67_09245 [Roseivirga seohaensis]|uniref:Uncharacterized protein n=1 Tax=Roseivirga seohaensis TaxID=1914963 RepID=A0A150XNR3_9BACT|nr:hypothetical protein [Roseivirga seohaensis]KYG80356.1 hypothetical protein AWW67_09245 [Roseivirga seohaensis]
MKPCLKFLALSIPFFFAYSITKAQNTELEKTTGYVNFSLGETTLPHEKTQSLSLFGCNTNITIDSKLWNGPKGFSWNKANQVLSGIPVGHQIDPKTNKPYYVAKYYIASPPVFKAGGQNDPNTLYDIGIVTPDNFVFDGKKPVQMVYLDYNVLKPMFIKYIEVKFDSSFDNLGVDFIPFMVECNDFPWREANGISGAQGASGIGSLTKDSTNVARLFLPYYYPYDTEGSAPTNSMEEYLDCEVTLLNDILFHYEVFFIVNGEKRTSINLKTLQNEKISFHAEYREELSAGCVESKQ